LLYANLQGLDADPLLKFFNGQKLIFGITDYNELPDWNGTPIQLFDGYIYIDDTANDHDKGAFSLIGNTGADYILGLTGSDRLEGKGGRDLLSGGKGDDVLLGGGGADFLAGGLGRDVLTGGAKADCFVFTDIADSAVNGLRDVISDFNRTDRDRIDVSAIDAKAGIAGNQAFVFVGDSGFTAEGQIRAYQFGDDTIVQFNTSGAGGSDMSIRLKGFLADTLTSADFIL
jgi:Ca2+-binding RTX toxin-like protein